MADAILEHRNEDALIVIANQQENTEALKTIIKRLRNGETVPMTHSEWLDQKNEKEENGSIIAVLTP